MWYPADYEDLFKLHLESAQDYTDNNPNRELAKSFFTSAHSLHDFHTSVRWTFGQVAEDRHRMQLVYLQRGIDALFSLFWLIRHHLYTAAYGRIRFLLETYLVVREFNRDKESTGAKYQEILAEYREDGYSSEQTDPMTSYVDGRRRSLLGDFYEQYDWFDQMMGLLSDMGAHPQSIQSMDHDKEWNSALEEDLFQFGNVFNFGIAAQYVRTFEDTDASRVVKEQLDPIFVQVMLTHPEIPTFLEEDLEFSSI